MSQRNFRERKKKMIADLEKKTADLEKKIASLEEDLKTMNASLEEEKANKRKLLHQYGRLYNGNVCMNSSNFCYSAS